MKQGIVYGKPRPVQPLLRLRSERSKPRQVRGFLLYHEFTFALLEGTLRPKKRPQGDCILT